MEKGVSWNVKVKEDDLTELIILWQEFSIVSSFMWSMAIVGSEVEEYFLLVNLNACVLFVCFTFTKSLITYKVGQKQKTEEKKRRERERERLNNGENNGQATHGARKHAWRTQAAWANLHSQMSNHHETNYKWKDSHLPTCILSWMLVSQTLGGKGGMKNDPG